MSVLLGLATLYIAYDCTTWFIDFSWVNIIFYHYWKGIIALLLEQELLTPPEHLRSPPVFSGGRVTRSLVLCVCFVDRCLSFCTFSFGHCVVCSWSIYGFWLPFWYLQTLLCFIDIARYSMKYFNLSSDRWYFLRNNQVLEIIMFQAKLIAFTYEPSVYFEITDETSTR